MVTHVPASLTSASARVRTSQKALNNKKHSIHLVLKGLPTRGEPIHLCPCTVTLCCYPRHHYIVTIASKEHVHSTVPVLANVAPLVFSQPPGGFWGAGTPPQSIEMVASVSGRGVVSIGTSFSLPLVPSSEPQPPSERLRSRMGEV